MTKIIKEDLIFQGQTEYNQLPKTVIDTFQAGDAAPSVNGIEVIQCNSTVVTITNFTKGFSSQKLYVKGHPNTTIANNTNIKTNTGSNKVLVADRLYLFVNINDVWYEH